MADRELGFRLTLDSSALESGMARARRSLAEYRSDVARTQAATMSPAAVDRQLDVEGGQIQQRSVVSDRARRGAQIAGEFGGSLGVSVIRNAGVLSAAGVGAGFLARRTPPGAFARGLGAFSGLVRAFHPLILALTILTGTMVVLNRTLQNAREFRASGLALGRPVAEIQQVQAAAGRADTALTPGTLARLDELAFQSRRTLPQQLQFELRNARRFRDQGVRTRVIRDRLGADSTEAVNALIRQRVDVQAAPVGGLFREEEAELPSTLRRLTQPLREFFSGPGLLRLMQLTSPGANQFAAANMMANAVERGVRNAAADGGAGEAIDD